MAHSSPTQAPQVSLRLNRQINLNVAADAALWPFIAGTFRIKQSSCKSHALANRLHAHIWLLKFTKFLPACMRVGYGLPPSYDKVERWITPYINGFWQCWKGFSESETPLLHGVLCESVAWSPCNSTSFALQCVCTSIPFPNATVPRWGSFCKLTCNWSPCHLNAGPPTLFRPWKAWHNLFLLILSDQITTSLRSIRLSTSTGDVAHTCNPRLSWYHDSSWQLSC